MLVLAFRESDPLYLCSLPRQSLINWGWSKSGGHKAEKVHHHGRYERNKDSVMGGSKAAMESAPAITARPRPSYRRKHCWHPMLLSFRVIIFISWIRGVGSACRNGGEKRDREDRNSIHAHRHSCTHYQGYLSTKEKSKPLLHTHTWRAFEWMCRGCAPRHFYSLHCGHIFLSATIY